MPPKSIFSVRSQGFKSDTAEARDADSLFCIHDSQGTLKHHCDCAGASLPVSQVLDAQVAYLTAEATNGG